MANNCFYDMRITGKRDNVYELIKMLQWKDEYKESGLGRTFSCDIVSEACVITDDILFIDVAGDCAWSVLCAMREEYKPAPLWSLEKASRELDLIIEVFSSECGCCFQEHVLIYKGDVRIDDCTDYEEHWVSGYNSLEEYNEENETNFTEDMINENGDICIGGFDNYGEFQWFGDEYL